MMNLTQLGQGEGGALHQIALMRGFRGMGHTVRMLTPQRPESGNIPADIRDQVILTPALSRFGVPAIVDALAQLPILIVLRITGKADTLYVRANFFTWLAVAVGRLLCMRVVVEHNSWCADERRLWSSSALACRLETFSQVASAKWAHMSRCVTRGIAGLLEQRGVPPEKIVTIGNGVDTDTMRPMAVTTPVLMKSDPAITRLGFIGGLVVWQGVEYAIEAMVQLRDVPHLELLIAGDGPERSRLEALTADLALGDQVRFMGYVPREDAAEIINSFDVALAPFTRERNAAIGLSPIKIRDYAAAGSIVVAAHIDGIHELSDGGWLFSHKPDDANDLAAVIHRILSFSDEERTAIRQKARSYAESHFDWRHITGAIAQHL